MGIVKTAMVLTLWLNPDTGYYQPQLWTRSQVREFRCPTKVRPNQVLIFSAVGSTRCHATKLTDEIVEKIRCGSAYAGEPPVPNEDYKASQECVKRFYDY